MEILRLCCNNVSIFGSWPHNLFLSVLLGLTKLIHYFYLLKLIFVEVLWQLIYSYHYISICCHLCLCLICTLISNFSHLSSRFVFVDINFSWFCLFCSLERVVCNVFCPVFGEWENRGFFLHCYDCKSLIAAKQKQCKGLYVERTIWIKISESLSWTLLIEDQLKENCPFLTAFWIEAKMGLDL